LRGGVDACDQHQRLPATATCVLTADLANPGQCGGPRPSRTLLEMAMTCGSLKSPLKRTLRMNVQMVLQEGPDLGQDDKGAGHPRLAHDASRGREWARAT
jgi:hypothetical protein